MKRRVGSNQKAKDLLGWAARDSARAGLSDDGGLDSEDRVKILVTGATGFVASHLVPSSAMRVTTYMHSVTMRRGSQAETDRASRQSIFASLAPPRMLPDVDAVVHLAQANVPFPNGAN